MAGLTGRRGHNEDGSGGTHRLVLGASGSREGFDNGDNPTALLFASSPFVPTLVLPVAFINGDLVFVAAPV